MSDDEVVSAIKFFHILNSMLYYPDSGPDDVVFAKPSLSHRYYQ